MALEAGIPVLQPESVKEEASLDELRELAPDLIVVMAYGQILPKALIAIPRLACINLHASLLPRHRGASCIQAAIDEGDVETGVTVMHVVAKLDAGDIILARSMAIGEGDTGGMVHDRMADLAAEALAEALPLLLAGTAMRTPQDPEFATYAPKLERDQGRLDWTWDAGRLERRIRAYEPWPGTWTEIVDGGKVKRIKIFPASVGEGDAGLPGVVSLLAETGGVRVACGNGYLELGEVQADGSRRMAARSGRGGFMGEGCRGLGRGSGCALPTSFCYVGRTAPRSCARHGHEPVRRNEMTGVGDNNRSEGQGGCREALSTKEVRGKGTTVGTRTGSEAAMRAMSVRENAKSNRHRKTHRVEPDGTGRKFMHLTRGDLPAESPGGAGRGRSSVEGRESGWSEGPKDQQKAVNRRTRKGDARSPAKQTGAATAAAPGTGGGWSHGGSVAQARRAEASVSRLRKEGQEDA